MSYPQQYQQGPQQHHQAQQQEIPPQQSQQPAAQTLLVHPGLGKVQGPQTDSAKEKKEELPYPVYVRPYDDELPEVTWRKNPAEPFGTLTILKGTDKMIVKVPMRNDRLIPRTNYPVEVGTVIVFLVAALILWKFL